VVTGTIIVAPNGKQMCSSDYLGSISTSNKAVKTHITLTARGDYIISGTHLTLAGRESGGTQMSGSKLARASRALQTPWHCTKAYALDID